MAKKFLAQAALRAEVVSIESPTLQNVGILEKKTINLRHGATAWLVTRISKQ